MKIRDSRDAQTCFDPETVSNRQHTTVPMRKFRNIAAAAPITCVIFTVLHKMREGSRGRILDGTFVRRRLS